MLKNRVIASIIYNGKTIVRGYDFNNIRPVGSLLQQIKIYNLREIDELIVYDISGEIMPKKILESASSTSFMPLTVGGGIRNLEDISYLLENGADKIILNTGSVTEDKLLINAVSHFGSQAISVGVDYRKTANKLIHYINNGKQIVNHDLIKWCGDIEDLGAGEIILTSIDHDGRLEGYDLDGLSQISQNLSIPVIASGGAGYLDDFFKALSISNIDAVCSSSFFLFTRYTPANVRDYLYKKGISVRSVFKA